MAWTEPKTIPAFKRFLASYWNTYVKDNLALLKTNFDVTSDTTQATHKTQLFGVGYSSGNINVGTGEDDAPSYDWLIPANFLLDGEAIYVWGTFFTDATAATRTLKLYVGSSGATIFTGTNVSAVGHFRLRLTRRSATTCACTGSVTVSVAAGGSAAGTIANVLLSSLDFTAKQILSLTLESSVATNGVIALADYHVFSSRGGVGTGRTV